MQQDESNIIDSPASFVSQNKAPIIAVAFIAVAFVIGLAAWQARKMTIESLATNELSSDLTTESKLQTARQYLGTESAALALITAASEQYDKKDYAGSIDTYNLFLAHYPHHALANAARLGKAWALEASDKTQEALLTFVAVGTASPADSYTPSGLLEAARIYKSQKKYAEARQVLNDCIRIGANSYYGKVAKDELTQIPPA